MVAKIKIEGVAGKMYRGLFPLHQNTDGACGEIVGISNLQRHFNIVESLVHIQSKGLTCTDVLEVVIALCVGLQSPTVQAVVGDAVIELLTFAVNVCKICLAARVTEICYRTVANGNRLGLRCKIGNQGGTADDYLSLKKRKVSLRAFLFLQSIFKRKETV